jgi:uncharacterized LabA/DUF88 family protein
MSSEKEPNLKRIIVYIDGFNFYFGLRESEWQCYYWLDFPQLATNLIRDIPNAELVATKYFSSRIVAPEDKRQRQTNYYETLEMRGSIEFRFGNYREASFECSACNRPNWTQNEKQTDVNIAVEMLIDAFENRFDMAVIISGDSDLVPPIREIKRLFPEKKIMACFPPKRRSKEIRKACSGEIVVSESDLKNNLLPLIVKRADGYEYHCPDTWK